MVQQPTRRADEQIHSFLQANAFCLSVHSAHKQTYGLVVEMPDSLGHLVYLDRQFSSWCDHDDSSSVLLLELEAIQELEARD